MPEKRLVMPEPSVCEPSEELEQLWLNTYLSNHALVTALERLRDSYSTLLTAIPAPKDKDKILAEVDSALMRAGEIRNWL